MPKLLLFEADARAALGRGVEKLTKVIRGTLGPKGGNTIIDRPVGTPIISRDGVSIIEEIELEDLFENMGAQVAREVSMQTNEEVGDGTTTALILANAIIQEGFAAINDQISPIEVVNGINQAIEVMINTLQNSAQPVESDAVIEAVGSIAATETKIGRLVAKAIKTVGPEGIIKVEFGQLGETTMELDEGASFDRGYLSHHMVTDVERMEAVLENPLILISDLRINTPQQILGLHAKVEAANRPLLLIAEEISGEALTALLAKTKAGGPAVVAVHPPEYGKWRKGLNEDIAIITGGQVFTRELGATIEDVTIDDMGTANQIRVTSDNTYVTGGGGDPAQIRGRRDHVRRQIELTEVMVDRDKLEARLAKLSGGVAIIRAGGVTPAERNRREQLIEDAINATRAAIADGVIPGGGTALVQNASALDDLIESLSEGARSGAKIVQHALSEPLRCIVENCGVSRPNEIVDRVMKSPKGTGFNALTGELTDLFNAGVIDPVRTPCSALRSAGSIAGLILTTRALVADKPEWDDPTYGATRGGGAEKLDMNYGDAGVMG